MLKKALVLGLVASLAGFALGQDGRVVREVSIRGNVIVNESSIRTVMRLAPGQVASRSAIERDENELLGMGFFKKVAISHRDLEPNQTDLVVDVEEYPIVKEIRIEGNTIVSTEKIEAIIKSHQEIGAIWNNRNAQAIVAEVKKLYEDAGFFADFEQLGPIDESPGTLNVKLLEATVGTITLQNLNRTKEGTIRRMMKTRPGEPFSLSQFQKDLQELYYTYWFEEIKPSRATGDSPSVFDLVIDFKEARTAQLNAGIALDPQSKLVGTLSYSDSNFMGNGQGIGVQLYQAASGGGPSAELAFSNRFYDRKDTAMSARVFSKVVYNFTGNGLFDNGNVVTGQDRFDERQTGLSLSFVRPYGKSHKATFGVLARNSKTINLTITTAENYVQQDGDLVTLQLGYEYNTANPTVEPVNGMAMRLLLEPGYSNITKIGGNVSQYQNTLGKSNFVRSTLQFRKYWSRTPKPKGPDEELQLDEPRPVIALRAEYGLITGTVPFFEQLFVGGSNSLRGYDNQRFWGSQSFLTSLEYRHPVQKSFNLIGFVDYGGAWGGYGEFGQFTQSQDFKLHLGYGVGLAFRTPLGPIRIDFAFNEDGKSRTHFAFGASF